MCPDAHVTPSSFLICARLLFFSDNIYEEYKASKTFQKRSSWISTAPDQQESAPMKTVNLGWGL